MCARVAGGGRRGTIGKDERHIGLVVGVGEDALRHLEHRSDAAAAGDEADAARARFSRTRREPCAEEG